MLALKTYEIADELREAILADEMDVERIESLAIALERKYEAMLHVSDELTAFAALCKQEEQRLAARRKAAENRDKRLRDYMRDNMLRAEVYEMEIGTKNVKLQKSTPAVAVDNEAQIPPRYWEIIPESKRLDKKALAADLKKGAVPGAHLEQGMSLRVR